MYPAVPLPSGSRIAKPVEVRLKAGWRFDPRRRAFVSDTGEKCAPHAALPPRSKVRPKVPSLAKAPEADLSSPQKELRRYVQVLLPDDQPPARYLDAIRAWPCVAEAQLPPEVSLPAAGSPGIAPG